MPRTDISVWCLDFRPTCIGHGQISWSSHYRHHRIICKESDTDEKRFNRVRERNVRHWLWAMVEHRPTPRRGTTGKNAVLQRATSQTRLEANQWVKMVRFWTEIWPGNLFVWPVLLRKGSHLLILEILGSSREESQKQQTSPKDDADSSRDKETSYLRTTFKWRKGVFLTKMSWRKHITSPKDQTGCKKWRVAP